MEAARTETTQIFIFSTAHVTCALPLGRVERVERMVAITPLPGLPPRVEGVINLHGQVIPVISLRRVLGLPVRAPKLSDVLVIAQHSARVLALWADATEGVGEREGVPMALDTVMGGTVMGDRAAAHGVYPLPDGVLLVLDLDAFLSPHEEEGVSAALEHGGGNPGV